MTQRQKQKVIGTETTSKLYDYTDLCGVFLQYSVL